MAGNVREGKILNINPAFVGLFKKTRALPLVDDVDIAGNRGLLYNNESMVVRGEVMTVVSVEEEVPAVGVLAKVVIGGAWKDVTAISVIVGGVWKDVSATKVIVGGVWKDTALI